MILLSVIIPILNEKEHVLTLIDNLLSQTYRPIEVLFVDGGSVDGTRNLLKLAAKEYNHSDFRLIFISETNFSGLKSPAHARNIGITMASGKSVVLLDADTLFVTRDSLSKLKSILDIHEFVSVKVEFSIEKPLEQQISLSYPRYYHCGYQKWIFNNLLFNEQLGFGEDRDLWYRITRDLNVQLYESEQVLLFRHLPHTVKEYFNQAVWYARSYPKFVETVLAEKEFIYITGVCGTLIGSFFCAFPSMFLVFSVLKDYTLNRHHTPHFLLINFLRRCLFSFTLLTNSFSRSALKNYALCISLGLKFKINRKHPTVS
jgi:glycosyltransferase involved in cell wall biosynthesis